MTENPKFEHNFLDLKREGINDHTSLGRVSLSLRSTLFWAFGLASLLIMGVVFVLVDQRIVLAMNDWRAAHKVSILMTRTQSSLARVEALEKSYALDKEPELTGVFSEELSRIGMALDELYAFPQVGPVRQHIATLRDGVEQYGQQFTRFVAAEEVMDTGISSPLQRQTAQLRQEFTAVGLINLADTITSIASQESDTLRLSAYEKERGISERFQTIYQSLRGSEIPKETKENLQNKLQAYQTKLMTLVNNRFDLERERKNFGEILTYMKPSTNALLEFTNNLELSTTRRLDQASSLARYSIAGATAAVLLWFMLSGILLFRSVVSPLQDLAFAAARLADGDRRTRVPARDNVDATGQIARALHKWIDDMANADQVRWELDKLRAKLELKIPDADFSTRAAAEPSDLHAEIEKIERTSDTVSQRKSLPASPIIERTTPARPTAPNPALAAFETDNTAPISLISQQLTHFSEYVTAAAQDVEQTETLVRNISAAMSHIEVLGNLVTETRHQVNLIVLNGKKWSEGDDGMSQESGTLRQLDAIRDSTDRTERTLQSARDAMEHINAISHDIAATASLEALEATDKLLSQSQYLQHILGDIMGKVDPKPAQRLSSPIPHQDQPSEQRDTPPHKA